MTTIQLLSMVILSFQIPSSWQQGFGQMTISVEPSNWIHYANYATVTFSFSPPCQNISIYTSTIHDREVCLLGPACPNATTGNFAGTAHFIDASGDWIRVSNATTLVNGYYYAICPDTGKLYRPRVANNPTNDLAIGLNPSVLRLVAEHRDAHSRKVIACEFKRAADHFGCNRSISLAHADSVLLAFTVFKGYVPNQAVDVDPLAAISSDFSFSIPAFDLSSGNLSFITLRYIFVTMAPMQFHHMADNPFQYTYKVNRADLAAARVCEISGQAVATRKGAPIQDIVNFDVDFTYPPTIGSISVERLSPCSCIFTCNVIACPMEHSKRVEWAFGDNSSTEAVTYFHGNDPSRIDRLILNSSDCQARFEAARRRPNSYNVQCRVYNAIGRSLLKSISSAVSEFKVPLYELLRPCKENEFQCASTMQCIPFSWRCNGHQNCPDGSDEQSCTFSSCHSEEFFCSISKQCIPNFKVCDSTTDCADETDESNCSDAVTIMPCGWNQHRCHNGKCVFVSQFCDGNDDCGDDSDEDNCAQIYKKPSLPVDYQDDETDKKEHVGDECSDDEFRCIESGECIPREFICDGEETCEDGSDEDDDTCAVCPGASEFHCNNNKCIGNQFLCDGDNDCGDESDELPELCGKCTMSPDMFQCNVSKKCIHSSRVCDMASDCGRNDTSDESLEACSMIQVKLASVQAVCPPSSIKCTTSSICVPTEHLCDGVADCCPEEGGQENETYIGTCEKTDEIGCNRHTNCLKNNGGCSDRCIPITISPEPHVCGGMTPGGEASYCGCLPGYFRSFSNLSSCIDVNECESPFANNCSQICTNTEGSYICSCHHGFVAKGSVCILTDSPQIPDITIVFSYDDSIQLWEQSNVSILAETMERTVTALDIDIRDGTVIFAEHGKSVLKRTALPVNGKQPPSLALHSTIPYSKVSDISIDFIGDNLYVADVDSEMKESRIIVSRTDGRYQKVLLSTAMEITTIATNPLYGVMYYATLSDVYVFTRSSQTTVIMTSMSGDENDNVEIYNSAEWGHFVQTIAIDYLAGGRLYFYFFDDKRIMLSNFDGSNKARFDVDMFAPSPRAFDIFGNMLYGFFSEWQYSADGEQRLHAMDKFSRKIDTILVDDMTKVANVRVYHPLKAGLSRLWRNPCQGLRCSHLCLLDLNGLAKCACPDNEDQQRCSASTIPEPDHPASCLETCASNRGVCAKDPNREAFVCICNPFFGGKYCNESFMADDSSSPKHAAVVNSKNDKHYFSLITTIVVLSVVVAVFLTVTGFTGFYFSRSHLRKRDNRRRFPLLSVPSEDAY